MREIKIIPEGNEMMGQACVDYIARHQKNPTIMERISDLLYMKVVELESQLHLPVMGECQMKPAVMSTENFHRPCLGYRLLTKFWKADDPRDQSGHREYVLFLENEDGKIGKVLDPATLPVLAAVPQGEA